MLHPVCPYRSQRDPLAADPDANQLVLAPTLPANSANVDPKIPLDVDGELLFNDYANRAPQQEKHVPLVGLGFAVASISVALLQASGPNIFSNPPLAVLLAPSAAH